MKKKIRSSEELFSGMTGAYPRAMFQAVGYHRDELKKPVIGVVSSWSEMHPGSYPNKELAQFVKAGVWAAGGTPVEFHTIAVCDADSAGQRHALRPSQPRGDGGGDRGDGRGGRLRRPGPHPLLRQISRGNADGGGPPQHPDDLPSPGTDALPFPKRRAAGPVRHQGVDGGSQGRQDHRGGIRSDRGGYLRDRRVSAG